MTLAAFFAACVWPVFFLFALLLKTARDPALLKLMGRIALPFFVIGFITLLVYGQSSVVAVFDLYFVLVLVGVALIWRGFRETYYFVTDWKTKLRALGMVAAGAACIYFPLSMLFQDLFLPPLVLEGRVMNPHVQGRRGGHYVAEIAGRTVNLTTPVYERFKLLPFVRVEVGRGSDYVYEVEYLTN